MDSNSWWRSRKWGYAAFVALIPYAVLKTIWAFGITIGMPAETMAELHAGMAANSGPRIFPRWMVLIPAWLGGAVFVSIGILIKLEHAVDERFRLLKQKLPSDCR